MRTVLVSILLLLFVPFGIAQKITLTWEPSPSTNAAGYRLYGDQGHIDWTQPLVKIDTGTNRIVTVDNVKPGVWHFMATAYAPMTNSDNTVVMIESDPSEELLVDVPAPPTNLMTVAVQWIGTLASTNWQDIGFFRLKIGPP